MTTLTNVTTTAPRTAAQPATRWLALGAIAGPILLTLTWIVLGLIRPETKTAWGVTGGVTGIITQPISGLGVGPNGFLMNAAFVLSGLLLLAGVVGVFQTIRDDVGAPARWIGAALLALSPLGGVVAGIFTLESSLVLHLVGALLGFCSPVLSFLTTGFLLRRVPRWRRFGNWLLLASPLTLLLVILYFLSFDQATTAAGHGVAGLTERILIVEVHAWFVAMGWLAFRAQRRNVAMNVRGSRQAANPMAVLVVLALGTFITLLDLTIVNVAIPSMLDGLHATLDQILWVLNAYSLAYAVLLITSGRLGDIVGPRNLFASGMVIFTAASALSGLAQDPAQLILARATQGLGAAILAPQGMAILLSVFPPQRRGGAFAVFGMLSGLAVVAGPTLGGFLVTHFGWRWIFFVNLPFGILTIALAMLIIPDLRPGRRHRLDLAGVALATAGLFGVVFGLIEGQRYDWGTVSGFVTIPMIIAAGVTLLVVFLVYQARRQRGEPLLPFALFSDRNFTIGAFVMAAMGFAILGLYLPLTIYFQSVLGLSAQDAGLTTAIQPLSMMFAFGLAGWLVQKVSPKYLLIPGLVLLAAGSAYIAWTAHADSSRWALAPGLIVSGLGMAFVWISVFSLATRDLRPHLAGVASGVINTIQELGAVIASAAVGALLQNRLATALHDQAVRYSAQLPPAFRGQFVDGFGRATTTGFEVGRGQMGGSLNLPAGVPASAVSTIQQLAHDVFTHAFVAAMRPSMALPIAVLLVAAVTCLALRPRSLGVQSQPAEADAQAAAIA